MAFRKYDQDGSQLGLDKGEHVFEDSRTEQAHKTEVDINNIVKRAGNMELIAKVNALQNFVFDDVTNNDFQESMNAIIKAKETFSSVPSGIRRQFDNDPAKFMDFVRDPSNADKLVEMGLANKPEVAEPIQVVVTNPVETPPGDPVP
jgi:phage internal scaffolding protein